VSAFGNATEGNRARSKASTTTSSGPRAGTPKEASPRPSAEQSKGEAAPESEVKASARKPIFRKEGEPFVVETAELQQPSTQTPTPPTPPPSTQTQRDATRPPGTEQQQSVPPTARPSQQDPTTPPSTQRPAPQTPPGVQQPPSTEPPSTTAPRTDPTVTATPTDVPPTETPTTTPTGQDLQEPNFPAVQPRPVPPLPSLARIGVVSGDTLTLSLNDSIRRALENNNEIEVARADVRLAESLLNSLRGVFDPVFTFTPQINNSVRPVVNIFGGAGTAGTVSTTDFNNDATINKQFGRGGGNFSYFFNNTREKTSASNNSINPIYSSAQGLQFTQPLWRDRSIDRNRQQIRIQQKRLQQSDADFRRRTIDIISQVQRAYWDLVFAMRDEQNQIANLNLARENFRRTEASVAAGASAPLERAEIQTELSNREAALLISNQQVSIAENSLKQLMLKDPLSPDWTKVLVPTDEPTFDETAVTLDSALATARENRPESRSLRLQGEINDIDLQYFKNQTKPRIDLVGTLQTNGLAGTPGPNPANPGQQLQPCTGNETAGQSCIPKNFVGGFGQTLQNLFSLNTRQIVVGVTIQLPLKNRTAQANLATARIQREQLAAQTRSQDQTIEVEVRNAVQAVETARRRVLSARQARASAEEQLSGERRLYQVGRSTTFLLFQRENALVNARNQELRAETDYNKALADLQQATSTTLRANNVIIDSPIAPERSQD
jgi:HAE1 family hydrophobic/amphiphilic exporter-1